MEDCVLDEAAEHYYSRAKRLFKEGKLIEAKKAIDIVFLIHVCPEYHDADILRADISYHLEDYSTAKNLYEEMIDDESLRCIYGLAKCEFELKEYKNAYDTISEAIEKVEDLVLKEEFINFRQKVFKMLPERQKEEEIKEIINNFVKLCICPKRGTLLFDPVNTPSGIMEAIDAEETLPDDESIYIVRRIINLISLKR